jgi:hypothetical protein
MQARRCLLQSELGWLKLLCTEHTCGQNRRNNGFLSTLNSSEDSEAVHKLHKQQPHRCIMPQELFKMEAIFDSMKVDGLINATQ